MDDPNDPELRTPFEQKLRAMVPQAERPNVDQLLLTAGEAAGRAAAGRSYRRVLAGLGLLCFVLLSAILFQRATQHQKIAALHRENLRLAQKLGSTDKRDELPEYRVPQEDIVSLASHLRVEDSARSREFAYIRLRDRLVRGDLDARAFHDRQPSTISVPQPLPPEMESSAFGRLRMQQQWLQGGAPTRGDAS